MKCCLLWALLGLWEEGEETSRACPAPVYVGKVLSNLAPDCRDDDDGREDDGLRKHLQGHRSNNAVRPKTVWLKLQGDEGGKR